MKGLVEDSSFADRLEDLNPTWSVDGVEICPDSVVDALGETLCSHSFDGKDGVSITLKVTNPTGGASEFTVVVDVLENSIPQVILKSPVETQTYYSDLKVEFEVEVSDAEDDSEDLVVTWTSDEDGALTELDGPPTSSGFHGGAALLSEGQHLESRYWLPTAEVKHIRNRCLSPDNPIPRQRVRLTHQWTALYGLLVR